MSKANWNIVNTVLKNLPVVNILTRHQWRKNLITPAPALPLCRTKHPNRHDQERHLFVLVERQRRLEKLVISQSGRQPGE